MSKVVAGLSVSLDGFVAGPNDGPDNALGDGGVRMFAEDGRHTLECTQVVESDGVTHLSYRVIK